MSQQPLEYEQMTYNSPDGAQAGRTSQDAVAFYGAVPVSQRASALQQIVTVSQTAGLLVVAQTNSQKEPTLTAQNISSMFITLTGAPMLSSADVVVLNKQIPLAQFGVAGVRVSTSSPAINTLILTLMGANLNTSGLSTTTPTSDQYLMAAFRGSVVNSVALTPASVAANNTAEQQFTVTGIAPGMLVALTKPTDQQSLGIAGTRVVSNNVLGVTFINTGNTAITPSAETYNYVAMAGAAPISPYITFGINMSQAGVITVTGAGPLTATNITVTGVQNSDQVIGIGQNILMNASTVTGDKPILIGAQVSTQVPNQVQLKFLNAVTPSTITAISTDTWLVPMLRQNCEAPMTVYPATVTTANIGPFTCTEIGVTVTGITVSCAILVSKPSFTSGIGVLGYRVSSVAATGSTVGITFGNPTSATIAIPTETYSVAAFKPYIGVGHYVQQMISPLNVQSVALTNEMRNTLAGMGIFAGA